MCTSVIGREDDILNKLLPNLSRYGQRLIGELGTLREIAFEMSAAMKNNTMVPG